MKPEDGTILASGLKQVRDEKPSQFTIGAYTDGHVHSGALTFDRSWKNGWGATAYARAWWNDQAVIPGAPKFGGAIGVEGTKKFGDR